MIAFLTLSKVKVSPSLSCSIRIPITSEKSFLYCLPALNFIATRYSEAMVLICNIFEKVL